MSIERLPIAIELASKSFLVGWQVSEGIVGERLTRSGTEKELCVHGETAMSTKFVIVFVLYMSLLLNVL